MKLFAQRKTRQVVIRRRKIAATVVGLAVCSLMFFSLRFMVRLVANQAAENKATLQKCLDEAEVQRGSDAKTGDIILFKECGNKVKIIDEFPDPDKHSPEKSAPKKTIKKISVPRKIGGTWAQNRMIRVAWQKWHDADFILTLEAESGWNVFKVSEPNSDGTRDHGVCQFNERYYGDFISSNSFHYWDLQLEKCHSIYRDAEKRGHLTTTFYGYNRIDQVRPNFRWI